LIESTRAVVRPDNALDSLAGALSKARDGGL